MSKITNKQQTLKQRILVLEKLVSYLLLKDEHKEKEDKDDSYFEEQSV